MKKKLAYIDYWHHEYTKSNDFLKEELSKEFEITNFWWSKYSKIPINEIKKFDNIFFFQVIFPYRIIKKLGKKNIIWAPMYDGLDIKNFFFNWVFWKQIFDINIKILSFSEKIKKFCEKNSIEYLNLQYFDEPKKNISKSNYPYKILFWYRGDIKLEDWIGIFNPNDVKKIYYIDIPDPGKKSELIDRKYLEKYNVEIIKKKFELNKKKFLDYLNEVDVFIAPRKKEGIGLPLIEAISHGKYVIGFDDSTMNEYITDKKIGCLFKNNIIKLNKNDVIDNIHFRHEYAEQKYQLWLIDKNKINEFILKEQKEVNVNFFVKSIFWIDDIKYFIKSILKKNIFKY
jgi:glycosyltransferase involved in cell wall biosynthesis